jgi:hypothetical protein
MQFLNRLVDSGPKVSRARHEDRSRGRRRTPIGVESLEGRDLKSTIPGVSVQYGVIGITATQADHNTASVSIDPSNQMLKISLNGNSMEINQGDAYTVNFVGSQGGSDVFENDTSLTETTWGYGGNNYIAGGSSWNVAYLYGDYNTFDARGAASYVEAYNGPNDNIPNYGNTQIYAASYDAAWFW